VKTRSSLQTGFRPIVQNLMKEYEENPQVLVLGLLLFVLCVAVCCWCRQQDVYSRMLQSAMMHASKCLHRWQKSQWTGKTREAFVDMPRVCVFSHKAVSIGTPDAAL
jgi:hypothetical protein